MSESSGPKLSLKVAINKQKSKVVFAEADNDVVDILLSFLTLPLGKIVRILENHYGNEAPVIGSLTSLYRGLSNLDSNNFSTAVAKQMLLNPTSSLETEFRRLKIDVTESQPTKYFVCVDSRCLEYEGRNISMHSDVAACRCGKPLNKEIFSGDDNGDADAGVFVVDDSSFIICDDLRVAPVSTGFLQTLGSLGIADADEAELSSFSFGIDDIVKLLELSITSSTPLTDLIIKNRQSCSTATKPEIGVFSDHITKGVSTSRKLILLASIQKSTNKFLFAQAKDDFIDFLLSFLTLPLGGAGYVLGGKTSLEGIDNLNRSVTDLIDHKCFRVSDTRNGLKNPKLAYGYSSKNHFLPLGEDSPPELYFQLLWSKRSKRYYYGPNDCYYRNKSCESLDSFTWSEGPERFVKEQKMFVVSDDLTMTPYSIASIMLILNTRGIPFSDVREIELQIGVEEALRILKASLTSTTVISDALITPMLNKLPKQESAE